MLKAKRVGVAGTLCLLMFSIPAHAQWYEQDAPPVSEQQIMAPFSLRNFNLATGGDFATWIAPGTDPKQTVLSFLARGGYRFEAVPIYIGLEVPLAYASLKQGQADMSKFVFGNLGLNVSGRLDPRFPGINIFTGWSLGLYLPTAMIPSGADGIKAATAYGLGSMTNLIPGLFAPDSFGIVANFDIVVPGRYLFFQFELSPAGYFPVKNTDTRDITGALLWGAAFGVHIADPFKVLLELEGYTPFNVKQVDGTDAPSQIALSTGFRLAFGSFKPALWVSFPLTKQYRDAFPDVIIGLDLAFAF